MEFPKLIDDIFSSDHELDEVLFDGFEGYTELRGSHKTYKHSPLKSVSLSFVQDFALAQGVLWDPFHPAAGGSFDYSTSDGAMRHYRWHGLLPPVARDGLLLSVRRHRLSELQLADFLPPSDVDRILSHLQKPKPVFVMGATGAGKTSFMMSALRVIAHDERVAILEHLPEIPKLSPHWIRLCAREADRAGKGAVSLSYLLDELLRLRPDRILVGELRREEATAFKRALLAGHGAVWTTVHASTPEELLLRLSELGAGSRDEWQEILSRKEALVVSLNRKSPRFQGLFQYTQEGRIISF